MIETSNASTVAVVTGGGRGIGRGIVLELAAQGRRVAINYNSDADSAEDARRAAEAAGSPEARTFRADVGNLEDGRRLVQEVLAAFGRVDVWVNNAGVAPRTRADLLEATPESWDRVVSTNLRGPYFLTQAVAARMLELKESGVVPAPKIIFITSISSDTASVNRGEYCVAKAGLSMTAQLFAVRLAEQGVLVYEVRPGVIETDMTRGVREQYSQKIADGLSPIRRWGEPSDVGKAVAALAAGVLPFSTGEVIHVDGGFHLRRL